jgi:hypothetical protein
VSAAEALQPRSLHPNSSVILRRQQQSIPLVVSSNIRQLAVSVRFSSTRHSPQRALFSVTFPLPPHPHLLLPQFPRCCRTRRFLALGLHLVLSSLDARVITPSLRQQ